MPLRSAIISLYSAPDARIIPAGEKLECIPRKDVTKDITWEGYND
jgi:hypothetical protein